MHVASGYIMVNLITGKMEYSAGPGVKNTPKVDLARQHKEIAALQENQVVANDKKSTKLTKAQLVTPLSMIGAGGVLLYLGLRTPSKLKIFRKGVDSRLYQMEKIVNSYCEQVNKMVAGGFDESRKQIQDFANEKIVKPAEYLVHFRKINKPTDVLTAKDLAMNAIYVDQKGVYEGGPCDFDKIAETIIRDRNTVDGKIYKEAGLAKLKLCDYVHVPKFSDGKYANKVAEAEAEITTRQIILDRHIVNTRVHKVAKGAKEQFETIAEVIKKSRSMILLSKQLVMDAAFKKIGKALDRKDLLPSHRTKNYSTDAFKELTVKELQPQLNIPNKIKKANENNLFLEVLEGQNFNNLTEDDIRSIFSRLGEGNDLNDLRFFIDGLRLEHEVAKLKSANSAKVYNVMIAKLKYLANELQAFGENELFSESAKNFNKLSFMQKPARVNSIVSVAKRLGYNSLEDLEDYFEGIYKVNPNFNIKNHLKIFLDDPENFFV